MAADSDPEKPALGQVASANNQSELISSADAAHRVIVGDEKVSAVSKSSRDNSQDGLDKLDSHIVHVNEESKEDDPLGHLPPEEAEIIRKQLDIPNVNLNYFSLFRYASRNDIIIIVISAITAVIGGAAMPLMTIIFGQLAGTFQQFALGVITAAKLQSELNGFTLYVFLFILFIPVSD